MSDWAHKEWTNWQETRTGYTWHAVANGRALCGAEPSSRRRAHPERQLRCGNCLRSLSAAEAKP